MNTGKIFEKNFKDSCKKDGIFVLRLRDAAQGWMKNAKYTHDNPYDFLVFKALDPETKLGKLVCLELKHTIGTSLSIQRSKDERSDKKIKFHQIKGLYKAQEFLGVKAGFLFNFSYENENKELEETTIFMDINKFMQFLEESDKKSINIKDILSYDPIIIEQKKKIKNYHYYIGDLIERA